MELDAAHGQRVWSGWLGEEWLVPAPGGHGRQCANLSVCSTHVLPRAMVWDPALRRMLTPPVPQLAALRLPARWLARGLAREGLSFGELQYWERLWGQQGVRVPLATRPFRAVHATAAAERANGDALLLRFSAGAFRPWLRRCGALAAAAAPARGRPGAPTAGDCARVWRRFFASSLAALAEAHEVDELLSNEADARGSQHGAATLRRDVAAGAEEGRALEHRQAQPRLRVAGEGIRMHLVVV